MTEMRSEGVRKHRLVGLTLVSGKEVKEILPESTAKHRLAKKWWEWRAWIYTPS